MLDDAPSPAAPHPTPTPATTVDAMGPYAFVFLNDDLTDAGIRRQLGELAAAGFRGVTLTARIGLSRRVGYLTEEFLRLIRVAVGECARLGLLVMLYDEASYPSGSADGAVVAADPRHAAQCLIRLSSTAEGPVETSWHPPMGRAPDLEILAAVATPIGAGGPEHDRAVLLPLVRPSLVAVNLPAGSWQLHAIIATATGGTIRGAHEDDGSALAPPAADLLCPDAVGTFLRLTHDAYAAALDEHLGSTVVAMFTDEPSLLGRGARRDGIPYTPGLLPEVEAVTGLDREAVLRRLPALWDDDGARRPAGAAPRAGGGGSGQRSWPGAEFAAGYHRAVRERLHRVYYGLQARWCADHGIALTGHPAKGDDLVSTALLDWPGQDTVWRCVLPATGTALTGPESTAAKVAASAARLRGAPTATSEVLGAYGWQLTLDEAKWLLDWYLVRGVATLNLHAFFYSVRANRAHESDPDLGRFSSLWPHLPALVGYLRRVCALLATSRPDAAVAVLTHGDHATFAPVADLLAHQIDFFYVTGEDLARGEHRDGRLHLGDQRYAVVLDTTGSAGDLPVPVVDQSAPDWLDQVRERLVADGRQVRTGAPVPGLRVQRLLAPDRSGEAPVRYLLVNEGEDVVSTDLTLPGLTGPAELWFPMEDVREPVEVRSAVVRVRLERRQSVVVQPRAAGASGDGAASGAAEPAPGEGVGVSVPLEAWTAQPVRGLGGSCSFDEPDDHRAPDWPVLTGLGDWTTLAQLRTAAGSYRYETEVDLPAAGAAVLDLGAVGEAASVSINEVPVGEALWAPYLVRVPAGVLRAGRNRVTVLVSNSPANHYLGARRASGLIGPVQLEVLARGPE